MCRKFFIFQYPCRMVFGAVDCGQQVDATKTSISYLKVWNGITFPLINCWTANHTCSKVRLMTPTSFRKEILLITHQRKTLTFCSYFKWESQNVQLQIIILPLEFNMKYCTYFNLQKGSKKYVFDGCASLNNKLDICLWGSRPRNYLQSEGKNSLLKIEVLWLVNKHIW